MKEKGSPTSRCGESSEHRKRQYRDWGQEGVGGAPAGGAGWGWRHHRGERPCEHREGLGSAGRRWGPRGAWGREVTGLPAVWDWEAGQDWKVRWYWKAVWDWKSGQDWEAVWDWEAIWGWRLYGAGRWRSKGRSQQSRRGMGVTVEICYSDLQWQGVQLTKVPKGPSGHPSGFDLHSHSCPDHAFPGCLGV